MKSTSIIKAALVAVILFSAIVFAKENPSEKRITEQIQVSLKSENTGLVESTIYMTLVAKKYYPELKYDKVVNELRNLAEEGNSAVIKYKAQLAVIYFNYPEIFKDVQFKANENPDLSFKMISEKLVNNSLVSN